MRIAINGTFWQEPHVGSGQYLHNLVQGLPMADPAIKYILVIPRYTNPGHPRVPGVQTVIMPTPFDHSSPRLAKLWFEQIAMVQVAHKLRADVIHVPYFGPPRAGQRPLIVSVLDLIPLLLPAYRGSRAIQAYMRLAAAGTRRAKHLIAISHATAADLRAHLQIPEDRITVTYLAAGPDYVPQSPNVVSQTLVRYHLEEPYLYYVGGFDLRKNLPLLIRAFAALPPATPAVSLVIAGRPPGSDPKLFPDLASVILACGVADRVALIGPVSDADNAALMSGARAFAYPSTYEGFGLPPLEAMACGTAVIAASTTSVGEIVGDGGVLADPYDTAAWTVALHNVIGDDHAVQRLRSRGLARARSFTRQATAEQTVAVYRRVV
ncbi:MAG: glycosyltransferase family 1 protein [Herpetosiphon sp.]